MRIRWGCWAALGALAGCGGSSQLALVQDTLNAVPAVQSATCSRRPAGGFRCVLVLNSGRRTSCNVTVTANQDVDGPCTLGRHRLLNKPRPKAVERSGR